MRDERMFALRHSVRMMAPDEAEVMLYGEIIENMRKECKWDEEEKSAADFKKAIDKAREDGAKRLKLRINSPGGLASEAVAMRSILADAGFEQITVRIEGMCASAATVPATLPGARVEIAEGSDYMIHNPWVIAYGEAADLEKTAMRLRDQEAKFRKMYVERTGQTDEAVKQWMDAETWFSAEDAVKYGFCDEVVACEPKEKIMACAGAGSLMKSLYRHTPERLMQEPEQIVSNGKMPAENMDRSEEETRMNWDGVTMDMLRQEAPELFAQACSQGAQQERERLTEIDELTPPGYEKMAADAKASGESALEFHKRIIRAQREKGEEFMKAREREVKPAANVRGEGAEEKENEKTLMDAMAKEIAGYASDVSRSGGMY